MSEPYTPEELAALEATAEKASSTGMVWPSSPGHTGRYDMSEYPAFTRETCLRLIHQLRQQTARAERAEERFHAETRARSRQCEATRQALAEAFFMNPRQRDRVLATLDQPYNDDRYVQERDQARAMLSGETNRILTEQALDLGHLRVDRDAWKARAEVAEATLRDERDPQSTGSLRQLLEASREVRIEIEAERDAARTALAAAEAEILLLRATIGFDRT